VSPHSEIASVRQLHAVAGTWSARIGVVRVEFGAGSLARLGELVAELGGRRAMLVTDPGIEAAGHVARALETFAGTPVEAVVFDGVEENPTTEHVEAGRDFAARHDIDFLVGIGGGSAMDCAKGINFLLTNGGRMEDYQGVGRAHQPMLPSLGVPTTAGTGSEAQSFALIATARSHRKMACGDEKAHFRTVILDPQLTATMPRSVAVATGLDAISHAVESYVCTARNPVSQMYAREAWRLLSGAFIASLQDPGNLETGGRMQLGAYLAGAAIECSMLGAAHACANPLTARFDVTHGIAVAAMLPAVVRFNAAAAGDLYADLSPALADELETLRGAAGGDFALEALGVERAALPELAADAATQWTAGFNPRPVGENDLLSLYRTCF
jgi:alcohol dehydrogenase